MYYCCLDIFLFQKWHFSSWPVFIFSQLHVVMHLIQTNCIPARFGIIQSEVCLDIFVAMVAKKRDKIPTECRKYIYIFEMKLKSYAMPFRDYSNIHWYSAYYSVCENFMTHQCLSQYNFPPAVYSLRSQILLRKSVRLLATLIDTLLPPRKNGHSQ